MLKIFIEGSFARFLKSAVIFVFIFARDLLYLNFLSDEPEGTLAIPKPFKNLKYHVLVIFIPKQPFLSR